MAALAAGLAFAIAVVLGAGWLAQVLAEASLTPMLRLAAAILFFEALCGVQLGILTGYEQFKTIAHINVWSGLLGVPITIAGVVWFGVPGVVVSLLLATVLRAAFGHWAIRRGVAEGTAYLSPRQFGRVEELPVLYKFSLPVILSNALVAPVKRATRNRATDVRVDHQPGFMLHGYPWRETSLVVEFFSRDFGRVALVARGAKRPTSHFRGLLSPFNPLAVGWTGRNDIKMLVRAEWLGGMQPLRGDALLAAFYANELLEFPAHVISPP